MKGLTSAGVSTLIPFVGPAVVAVVNERAFDLYRRNTESLVDDLRLILASLGEGKLDTAFLESDEFTAVVLEVLSRNARSYERAKVTLFARILAGCVSTARSSSAYKEGFIRIVDGLSPVHIHLLSNIYEKAVTFTQEDRDEGRDHVDAREAAEGQAITHGRATAYCDQMVRYGLLYDWSIGRWDYTRGKYALTNYGTEFVQFLRSVPDAAEEDDNECG